MPDLKISQLPVASTPLAGTELVPIVQGGVTDQTTIQAIMTSTVPSGTANGVLYLNGSKVATSGSALTFDGTNTFGVNSASATTIAIDSSGGNFLRGVSFRASGSEFGFDRANSSTGEYRHAIGPSSGWGGFHTYYVDGSEQMRLTSTGLGIGTSSPATKLHVDTGAAGYGLTLAASSLTGRRFQFGIDGSANLAVYDTAAAAVRMTLDGSGNLGLGVTPSAWATANGQKALQIAGVTSISQQGNGSANVMCNAYESAANAFSYVVSAGAMRYNQSASGGHSWYTAPSGTAGNAISFTQAMTLDADGNLLVGTTSANLTAAGRGLIVANGSSSSILALENGGTTAFYLFANGDNTDVWNSRNGYLRFATNSTERARITSTGNVVAGGSVALATNATDGFLYVPTCAGTPTGTPTAITGMAPIVVDTTNNKMYFYSGGAWRDAGP